MELACPLVVLLLLCRKRYAILWDFITLYSGFCRATKKDKNPTTKPTNQPTNQPTSLSFKLLNVCWAPKFSRCQIYIFTRQKQLSRKIFINNNNDKITMSHCNFIFCLVFFNRKCYLEGVVSLYQTKCFITRVNLCIANFISHHQG